MTLNFNNDPSSVLTGYLPPHGEAANFNAPSTWRERAECVSTGGRGKIVHGFTLIELLVVVLIIGILAAVALPQYQKSVRKARLVQVVSVFDTLSKSIDMYLLENGYPDTRVWFTGTTANNNPILRPQWKSCSGNGCIVKDEGSSWGAHCLDECEIYLWGTPLFGGTSNLRLYRTATSPTWLFGGGYQSSTKEVCQFIRDTYGIDKMNEDLQTACAKKGIL